MTSVMADIVEIGAVGAGLAFLWVLFRNIMAFLGKMHDFLDDWNGTPARPGVAPRPGVMVRLDAIEHELHPNSNLSMRDAVDRIEKAVAITPKIERIAAAVDGGPEALHVDPESPPSA